MLDLAIGIISFALTIMVFSYILGDNFFFRLAVYLLVGISTGYTAVILITKVIVPYLLNPLTSGNWQSRLIALVPVALSALLVGMIFPKLTRAGRVPLAILLGIIAGMTVIGVTIGTIVPQMQGIIEHFSPNHLYQNTEQSWVRWTDAIIMLIGAITSLLYFHFGLPKKLSKNTQLKPAFSSLSKVGQVFIGITLGALFVGIYSTALIALISRISQIRDFFNLLIGS